MAEFLMPSLGADMQEATLVKWLVKPGDQIKRGHVIGEVDTAKGVIDLECFQEGTCKRRGDGTCRNCDVEFGKC